MRVRLARGPGAFDELAATWGELSRSLRIERHAQLEEWARAASGSEGAEQVWFCADDDDGPLAILHGNLSRRRQRGVAIRVLRNGIADGLLAARCRPEALRAELFRTLARAGEPVDMVSFNRMREGSAFHSLAAVTPGRLQEEHRFGGCSVVDTTAGADEWFARAGKNLRGALRKARNRAARAGDVQIEVARTPAEVRSAFAGYVELEAAGWKGGAGALVNRPVEHRLLREALLGAAGSGRAAVWALRIGGELAASQMALLAGRSVVLLKVAYAEDLASMAPGKLLMEELVRECCDDPGIERIDLVTSQDWHARWHPATLPTFRMQEFNTRRVAGLLGRTAALVGPGSRRRPALR